MNSGGEAESPLRTGLNETPGRIANPIPPEKGVAYAEGLLSRVERRLGSREAAEDAFVAVIGAIAESEITPTNFADLFVAPLQGDELAHEISYSDFNDLFAPSQGAQADEVTAKKTYAKKTPAKAAESKSKKKAAAKKAAARKAAVKEASAKKMSDKKAAAKKAAAKKPTAKKSSDRKAAAKKAAAKKSSAKKSSDRKAAAKKAAAKKSSAKKSSSG
ncbi:histone H1-like repetitive region-containing protein [Wenjunlia tyrosinilytica]|uniref:Uncharacterized protein n=1 Tax=Wenjunlia tyrosinilytica TaxID=1544741 RepID=A0A917ZSV7_9ACTN|nr:histone H1-like repetitive region-containing protein [Wenjunlia tyrosinilytica]GGO91874.1 hypothetical protein GCM10012280_40760 [Wenjunlia tyrosinilytica]